MHAPDESDASISTSLLVRAQAADGEAWKRLTRLFEPLVCGWVRRASVPEADGADVVQDVFLEVFRSIGQFRRHRTDDTFAGWVRTIARRRACDYFRRTHGVLAAGGTEANDRMLQVPDDPSDDAEDPTETVVQRGLDLIRGEFEARTWNAFEATTVNARPAAEVGAELGLSVGAVYIAKSRVLKRLREELDGLI